MIEKNAPNIVITSWNGIKNGYKHENQIVEIKILVGLNAAERDVSELIMKTAIDQGPIDGIFNFAVFLKDSICRNQISETFEESFKEETRAAKCLGEETRKFCQNFCS